MNYKMMGRLIALILAMEAVFMLPALLICLYDGRLPSAYGFLYTIGILLVYIWYFHETVEKFHRNLSER